MPIVIDLRQNPGGDILPAFAVGRYLSDNLKSFAVRLRRSRDLLRQTPDFAPILFDQFKVPGSRDLFDIPAGVIKQSSMTRLGRTVEVGLMNRFYGNVFLLISNLTFSSANLFATIFRDNHLSLVVGEPTGNEINFRGQMITLEIPNLPVQLNVSASRTLRPDSKMPNEETFLPDITIPRTSQDVRSGVDRQLNWVRHFRVDRKF